MNPTVTSVSNTTNPTTASSTASTTMDPSSLLGNNFNTFLTLLTTQLKNQDPTSPLDTNQFTQQLVSMSQVEQAINTNTKLSTLVSMAGTSQALSALPLVGKTVEYDSSSSTLSGGSAQFSYSLASQSAATTLTVSDANGKVVFQGPGETGSGRHVFTWNGRGTSGVDQPDGTYTISVAATDASKNTVATTTTGFGTVTGIQLQNNQALMTIGGTNVPTSKLISISQS
jgi:flagellar basal-body rod modification protein FlgD